MQASIIIPTYKRVELLLQRSLKSALKQDFNDYEIIVVDDASKDETDLVMQPYVKKYPNLKYINLPQNKGLSYVRNYGIKKAQGEYVVCLDDDNELLPDFLKETTAILDKIPVEAVSVGKIVQYKDIAKYAPPSAKRFQSIDQAWLFRKEVFDHIQYDEELKANEDMDFGIRFFNKGFSHCVLDKPLAVVYNLDDPDSLSYPTQRELDGISLFIKKNLKYYIDPNELRYLYRVAGRKFYRGGFKLKGLNYFWKSFLAYPRLNSFAHLVFILMGWKVYDKFMTFTENYG